MLGMLRSCVPTCTTMPLALTASTVETSVSMLLARGFSQYASFLASAAAVRQAV